MRSFRNGRSTNGLCSALVALSLIITCFPAEAQVFGEGGLFNRKKNQAGQSPDEIGVPVPKTGKIEALKGHEVTFEIMAESKTPGATVEFLIRTFPSAGKIVSMVSKPSERNKVLVTYYADPNSGATEDAFAFAVRYRGGRYSSAMRYDISLVDHKADIVVTEGIDFGEVMIGDESVRDIVIVNSGDGTFSRQLFVGPPWHILEPSDGKLVIGPNGRRAVRVAFRPELSGQTSYFLGFSRSKRGTTKLEGTGKPSFELITPEVELVLNEETDQREGELLVMNHSGKPLRVSADASSRLKGSLNEAYLLAPRKETRIPINLWKTDTAPFDGAVKFRLKTGYVREAKVVAQVAPGRIAVNVPGALSSEVINFGKVQGGEAVERQITVTNIGGLAVPLEFHIPEPFRLLTDPGPSLGSMSEIGLSLGLYPPRNYRGVVDANMKVQANGQSISIRLLGNVIKPEGGVSSPMVSPGAGISRLDGLRLSSGPALPRAEPKPIGVSPNVGNSSIPSEAMPPDSTKVSLQTDSPKDLRHQQLSDEAVESMTTPSGHVAVSLKQRNFKTGLRSPEDLTVVESKSDSLVVGWTAPRDSELCRFEVEKLVMFAAEGGRAPVPMWVPHEDIEFERINRLVKATIKGLAPAASYEIRVLMLDEDEQSSAPSDVLVVKTELSMGWTYFYLTLGVAALIVLGYGIYQVMQNRPPEVYESEYADL